MRASYSWQLLPLPLAAALSLSRASDYLSILLPSALNILLLIIPSLARTERYADADMGYHSWCWRLQLVRDLCCLIVSNYASAS